QTQRPYSDNPQIQNASVRVTSTVNNLDETRVGYNNRNDTKRQVTLSLSLPKTMTGISGNGLDLDSRRFAYAQTTLDVGKRYDCLVVSAKNSSLFTLQLLKDVTSMKEFAQTLFKFYFGPYSDQLVIDRGGIQLNLCCMCRHCDDGYVTWYRSQIIDYNFESDTCDLFYVDYNFWREHVPRTRLRYILKEHQQEPVRILTCQLNDIQSQHGTGKVAIMHEYFIDTFVVQ
ncbi:unnamed protein product, partial [Didymodactylos carnosus]